MMALLSPDPSSRPRIPDSIQKQGYADNAYATVRNGFIDTVLVMPGEAVGIIKPLIDYMACFFTTVTIWNMETWA